MSRETGHVSASHPVSLADGRMVGPGETVKGLDSSSPHNARLVEIGHVVIEPKAPRKKNNPEPEAQNDEESK